MSDSTEEVWTRVRVCNPITHNTWDHGKYTTYEITIETNNPAFTLFKSCVRRRYSEFQWLKNVLEDYNGREKVPPLPGRSILELCQKRFEPSFIYQRMKGLEEFVKGLVSAGEFLSATATHLFLQSCVITEDIDRIIHGHCKANVLALIKETGRIHEHKRQRPRIDHEYSRFLESSEFDFKSNSRDSSTAQMPKEGERVDECCTTETLVDLNVPSQDSGSDVEQPNQFQGNNSLQFRHGAFCGQENGLESACNCGVVEDIAESSFSASGRVAGKKNVTFCNEVTVAKVVEKSS